MTESAFTIVGGGIMGLSIAYRLARGLARGLARTVRPALQPITVIDDGNFLSSASSQAAGILATHGAEHFLSPLRRQIVESIRSYPDFLSGIDEVLGKDSRKRIGYRPLPHYHLYDPSSPEQEAVRRKRLVRMTREKSSDGHPGLPPLDFSNSDYFSSGEISGLKFHSHVLSPIELLKTLREAGEGLGVKYLNGRVTAIKQERGKTILNYLGDQGEQTMSTGKIILTPGSGTDSLLPLFPELGDGFSNRLRTLNGTILITEPFLPEQEETLITLYDKKYLLHSRGRALFGSHDWRGDDSPSYSGETLTEILLENLIRLFPHLRNKPPRTLGLLMGKRSYYRDKLPLLGYINPQTFICTALFKSGLALAPLYSRLSVEVLTESVNPDDGELRKETDYLSPFRRKGR